MNTLPQFLFNNIDVQLGNLIRFTSEVEDDVQGIIDSTIDLIYTKMKTLKKLLKLQMKVQKISHTNIKPDYKQAYDLPNINEIDTDESISDSLEQYSSSIDDEAINVDGQTFECTPDASIRDEVCCSSDTTLNYEGTTILHQQDSPESVFDNFIYLESELNKNMFHGNIRKRNMDENYKRATVLPRKPPHESIYHNYSYLESKTNAKKIKNMSHGDINNNNVISDSNFTSDHYMKCSSSLSVQVSHSTAEIQDILMDLQELTPGDSGVYLKISAYQNVVKLLESILSATKLNRKDKNVVKSRTYPNINKHNYITERFNSEVICNKTSLNCKKEKKSIKY